MPTPTYIPLATLTLTGSDSSITFSSIPATYRDLILIANMVGTGTTNNGYTGIRLNSDSTSSYSRVFIVGNGSTAFSSQDSGTYFFTFGFPGSTSNSRSVGTMQIMDYSATDKHKTMLAREDNNPTNTAALAARWAKTEAVNSISLTAFDNSWAIGSTFSLYGVN